MNILDNIGKKVADTYKTAAKASGDCTRPCEQPEAYPAG
jgi:hypothetical protein